MSDLQKFFSAKRASWTLFVELSLFLCLALFGIYGAISTGISADEEVELKTYLLNLAAVKGLISGDISPYQALISYHDRYYGIGFHWISHGLAGSLSLLSDPILQFSQLGSRLIWAHLTNFLAFMAAGIIFRQCILLLTQDRLVSVLGMFTFLLWPYLLGHALMNVKDIPFLCIWLACTYQLMRIFKIASTQKNFPMLGIAFLGALTGWLISIRVSGVLVFVQYFCFGLVLIAANWRTKPINFCLQTFIYCFSVLILVTGITLYILYPILWHNPLELINAISYMGSHPWQGNTLTAGEFIEPKTRLIYYLYSWLLIKLPSAAILGLLVLPIAVYLIKRKGDISFRQWMTFGLLFSTAIILCVLIGRWVALYNELRQILFLFPLLLMVSIVSLFFLSRQLVLCILLASNIFMLIDDLNLHPYQYSYINEVRRHSQLGSRYETDYFGLSIAETARWLNQSKIDGTAQCLYVPSPHQWRYYLDPKKFPCLDGYPGDLSLIKTPFLFFVQPRGSARYPAPPWCALRYEEIRKPFSSDITQRMGELYECRP